MTPEFGQIALILALLLSLAQGVLPLIGAWRGNTALIGIARPAAVGQAMFVWIAFGLLAWSLLWLDFSVRSVADNANILPWYYRFAAVWGAHEGSFKPFIRWIWAGGLLMMMAGVVSVGARRFRAPVIADKAAASSAHDAFVIAQESHP